MLTNLLGRLAAGLSLALCILAVGSLTGRVPPAKVPRLRGRALVAFRLNRRAWSLIASSALIYRPLHSGWLLGRPFPRPLVMAGDAAAVATACLAFSTLFASRGVLFGLSARRIRAGYRVNLGIVLALAGGVLWAGR